jgi:rSAM/selenodomain-associated transferase 2
LIGSVTLPPGAVRPDPGDRAQWSVVIPTLQEVEQLPGLLAQLQGPEQVLVVDGGSSDGTVAAASAMGALVIHANAANRGLQLSTGAAHASRPWLLFIHADARLPMRWSSLLAEALEADGVVAAAFRLRVDGSSWKLRLLERLVGLRSRWRGLPYGDQGLALSADVYHQVGGYRPLPLMEDLELVQRLGCRGRLALAAGAVLVSDRRWRRLGVWRSSLRNARLRAAWRLGTEPEVLARRYR